MGLDQYAYVAARAKQRDEFYEQEGLAFDGKDWVVPEGGFEKPRELAYWRKHPNLQGWMQALYESKEGVDTSSDFNGVELELTWADLELLEQDILNGNVAKLGTSGFFFGDPSDDYYRESDLAFVKKAKAEVFCGLRVFYNSSW
jgi:hypothetical protein